MVGCGKIYLGDCVDVIIPRNGALNEKCVNLYDVGRLSKSTLNE